MIRLILPIVFFFICTHPQAAEPEPAQVWSAWQASAELHVYPQSLEPLGINLERRGQRVADGQLLAFDSVDLGSLALYAPAGNFERFIDGSLTLDARLRLARGEHEVIVDRLVISPAPGETLPVLIISDAAGRALFTASHIHVYTVPERSMLRMDRMDVRMTAELADRLGVPEHAGHFVGELEMLADLHIPEGASLAVEGGQCDDRPRWATDGHRLDVELTAMGQVSDRGTVIVDDRVYKIMTPSATLRNDTDLEAADVPWWRKLTGSFPPHDNDQHPYLIWNLYRIVDGRLEHLAASGIKHAFTTININCTLNCGDGGISGGWGHILWPGCVDIYGVGNNDSNCDLGPRHEVNPRTGIFESVGSFFDPGSTGTNTNCSSAPGENRLMVWDEDLKTADAQYYFDAWYVIRDDVDIFNGMGFHPLTPNNTSGNNWSFQLGAFSQGPAADVWVSPGSDPASGASNELFHDPDIGHFKVLTRTQQVSAERWRYTYFVMNYDVDHGIEGLLIPAPTQGTSPGDFHFNDPDYDGSNDWPITIDPDAIRFDDPGGNPVAWGTGYTFEFEIDAAPVAGEVEILLGSSAPVSSVSVPATVPPFPELIFADNFE